MEIKENVSVNTACDLLGVSRRTIYNWMNGGKVEWFETPGGSRRIIKETLFRDTGNGTPFVEKSVQAIHPA